MCHKTLWAVLLVLNAALSTTSLFFSLVSWILIKKWRQFRNFALLSFIVTGAFFLIWLFIWDDTEVFSGEFILMIFVIMISHIQMTHSQLIAMIVFYMDIVNVFSNVEVRCKYLLTNLFIWLLPIIEILMMLVLQSQIILVWIVLAVVELVVFLTNVVLYVRVLCVLVRLVTRREITLREVCGKALVLTFACVTAGVLPMLASVALIFCASSGIFYVFEPKLAMLPNLVNLLLANMFFLSLKNHRVLWSEYISRSREARAMKQELKIRCSPVEVTSN